LQPKHVGEYTTVILQELVLLINLQQLLEIWENYITQLYNQPNQPESLEVKPEEEADTEEKGPYILQT
jgi:hypothetical protein